MHSGLAFQEERFEGPLENEVRHVIYMISNRAKNTRSFPQEAAGAMLLCSGSIDNSSSFSLLLFVLLVYQAATAPAAGW